MDIGGKHKKILEDTESQIAMFNAPIYCELQWKSA